MTFQVLPASVTATTTGSPASAIGTSNQKLADVVFKFDAFKAVPHSDIPEQKALNRQTQFDRLHEAYALCLPLTSKENPLEVSHAALTRLSMILGEFGILHYGQEPHYPAISSPKDAAFTLSHQILQCALHAFLTRIGADTIKWDFNQPATTDLKDLPNRIWQQNLFAPSLEGFCQSNLDALLHKVGQIPFSEDEALYLSRMMRYLNGAARHIRYFKILPMREKLKNLTQELLTLGNDKGTEGRKNEIAAETQKINVEIQKIEDADRSLTIHTLYIARDLSKNNPKESWEIMYNDWADAERAEGKWTEANNLEKKLTLGQWLLDNTTTANQKARTYNKFFGNIEGTREALKQCLGIIQKGMKGEDFTNLQAVLQGKILDQNVIDTLAKKLSELNLSQQNLMMTVDWFVIVPSNLAVLLQADPNSNQKEIEGLLRFAVALIQPHLGKSNLHINHKAVLSNWATFSAKLAK